MQRKSETDPGAGCVAAKVTRLLPVGLVVIALGCSAGIRWRLDTFERVHAESRAAQKLTMVYLRNWYSVACTEFEENVLKTPVVIEATADLICVPLEYDLDRSLAEKWRIPQSPGIVIVSPAGDVLARRWGKISQEELLQSIEQSRRIHGGVSAEPASP
ncbi:MAG: hypothetical protein KKB50_11520 [Planctomycetes bacterium]|nr:hypothetical protein [Planctomycetota bacterium]